MFAVTGVTGHVGGAAARELLAAGAPVRAIVRDPRMGREFADRGAEVAVADFTDPGGMAEALAGCAAAFVMLPVVPGLDGAGHRVLAGSIAEAVESSGVPHVVVLSSVGADLSEGTGPITWLHRLEERLRVSGATVTAIRSPHFQEKVEEVLEPAIHEGVYPVFGSSADVPIPMVATRDVGAAVARHLLEEPESSGVVGLEAPAYTEREVAEHLAGLIGRPALQVVLIPREGWIEAMTGAGMSPLLAEELFGLYDAGEKGLLEPRGEDRRDRCETGIETTLRQVVPAVR